jgi:uncharacterized protein YggU (UPF0235/DUF167 family)
MSEGSNPFDGSQGRLVRVAVSAGARRDHVAPERDGSLRVSVREDARGGRANERVCELLAGYFDVEVDRVHIVQGHRGSRKIIEIRAPQ